MKKLIYLLSITILTLSSCADSKTLELNGRVKTFEPYGWADYQNIKNDSIIYKVNVGNIVWDVLLSSTIVVPIWLTGWQFYEPYKIKSEYLSQPIKQDTIIYLNQ